MKEMNDDRITANFGSTSDSKDSENERVKSSQRVSSKREESREFSFGRRTPSPIKRVGVLAVNLPSTQRKPALCKQEPEAIQDKKQRASPVDRYSWDSQVSLIQSFEKHVFANLEELQTKLIDPLNKKPDGGFRGKGDAPPYNERVPGNFWF
jgi:hypothetical protein